MNPEQYNPQPGQTPPGYQPQPGPFPPVPPANQPTYPPQAVYGPQPPQPGQRPGPAPGYPAQPTASGYNPYPYPGEYSHGHNKRRKGPNKAVLGIFVIIVIVGILFAALAASSGNNGQTPPAQQNNENESTAVADVVPRTDGLLDLTKRTSATDNLKAQVVKAKEKEQVNLSSGFSFMVNKVEAYESPNPTTKPADKKKFIVFTVVVGNRTDGSNISVSYLDFRMRDKNNQLIAGHITTNEILNNPLASPTELKPGEQLTGKVVFEADVTDTSWVFKHSETYEKTTDNTTFTVEGEIVTNLSTATSGTTPTPSPASPTPTPTTPDL